MDLKLHHLFSLQSDDQKWIRTFASPAESSSTQLYPMSGRQPVTDLIKS